MSWEFATTEKRKARKDYNCEACDWVLNDISYVLELCSYAEKRDLVKAKRNKWHIKKGQEYLYTSGMWDGEWCVFRAIPEIDSICQRHDLYDV